VTMADLILYFDGLTEPYNPGGWACYGWLVKRDGATVASGQGVACPPGRGSTNNVAEYAALIAGLEALRSTASLVVAGLDIDGHDCQQSVEVRGDSQLVINQVTGAWRCNVPHLRPLLQKAKSLAGQVGQVSFRWVPRERNTEADALSRQAYAEAKAKAPARRN
jgi:ribonuclease HI